jgi:hypothetical protein
MQGEKEMGTGNRGSVLLYILARKEGVVVGADGHCQTCYEGNNLLPRSIQGCPGSTEAGLCLTGVIYPPDMKDARGWRMLF